MSRLFRLASIFLTLLFFSLPIQALDVLVLGSATNEAELADVKNKLESTGVLNTVSTLDVRTQTPSLIVLQDYDAVLVYSTQIFADPAALGDVLADYVDAGGGVVQMGFSFDSGQTTRSVQGRWNTEQYPVWVYSGDSYSTGQYWQLGSVYEPDHPIMAGVDAFDGGYRSYHHVGTVTNPGVTTIALYKDRATPLVAANQDTFNGCVAGLNYVGPSTAGYANSWRATDGDGAELMANALKYCARGFLATHTVPNNGSTGLLIDTDVAVHFNRDIDATSVSASTVSLTDAQGTSVPATYSVDSSLQVVTITPSSYLSPSTTYTVTVDGVLDASGNPLSSLETFSSSFTTADSNTLPELNRVLIIAADNSETGRNDVKAKLEPLLVTDGIDIWDARFATPPLDILQDYDAVLVYSINNFSDPTALGDVLADYVDAGGGVVQMGFSFDSGAPTRSVQGRWNTEQYPVWVYSIDSYTTGQYWQLGSVYEPDHPIMAGVDAFDGGYRSYHHVGTVTNPGVTTIALYKDRATPLVAANQDTFNGCVAGLNYVGPSVNGYSNSWRPTAGDGAELMANALKYCARGFLATHTVPNNGSTELLIDTDVDVHFNRDIDATSVSASTVSLTDAQGTSVPATYSVDSSLQVVTITPSSYLSPSTTYTVTVDGVLDASGNPLSSLETFSSSFTTADSNTLPELNRVLIIAADNSETGRNDVKAKLEPLLVTDGIDIWDARFATPPLDILQDYDAVLVYSINNFSDPTALGDVLADYVDAGGGVVQMGFSFDSGAPTRSVQGRWNTEQYPVWVYSIDSYTTGQYWQLGSVYEPDHPIMAGVDAFDGGYRSYYHVGTATNPGATTIALYKDRATPLVAANQDTFNGCVAGLNYVGPSVNGYSNSWRPTAGDGAELMANALKYCARGFLATHTVPNNGSTGLVIDTDVAVHFNRDIDATSVSASTVSLTDAQGTSVPATYSVDSSLQVVTITPSSYLSPSTTYTVTVDGVLDASGNPLSSLETFSSSFTTTDSNTLPELNRVLIIAADNSETGRNDVKAKLEPLLVTDGIDIWDARFATPPMDILQDYDAVLVYSIATFADPTALGDVLADYVDAGGGVVQMGFSFDLETVRSLQGRWNTEQYPVWVYSGDTYTTGQYWQLGSVYEPDHPIMAGVDAFDGGYRSYHHVGTTTNPGVTTIALYKDRATPLVAANQDTFNGCVAGLNYVGPSVNGYSNSWRPTAGDGAELMANALKYCAIPQGLRVLETQPENAAFNVDQNTDIRVRFNNELDVASLSGDVYQIVDSDGLSYTANFTIQDSGVATELLLQQQAGSSLPNNNTYIVTLMGISDVSGNVMPRPYAFDFSTPDTTPPLNPETVNLSSAETQLTITWTESTSVDVAGYILSINGVQEAALPKGALQYTFTDLTAATPYQIGIKAYDYSDLFAEEVIYPAATLYSNPSSITAEPLGGKVGLAWSVVSPDEGIAGYRIYVSEADYSNVSSMTHVLEVPKSTSSATIAQLTNGTLYYFAVATVTVNGSINPIVVTTSERPNDDTAGPELSGLSWNDQPLVDGQVIDSSGQINVTASDESGVSRVEFYLDGNLFGTDFGSNGVYSAQLDIDDLADGVYTLLVRAFDTLDKTTDMSISIQIDLAAPVAPVILSPTDGLVTNQTAIDINGSAVGDDYQILNNGVVVQDWAPLSTSQFNANIVVQEGANAITAKTRNRGGESLPSATVNISVDLSIPEAPAGLVASGKEAGQIVLNWNAVSDENVAGYDIYRSSTEFSDISTAERVNTNHLTVTSFTDVPFDDGNYYYRVIALNELETASLPSNLATAVADSEAPYAIIEYVALGQYDAANDIYGRGDVAVTVRVSEPLLSDPFVSIKPGNGPVQPLSLEKQSDLVYTSVLQLDAANQSGVTLTTYSARDVIGNQGTEIQQGGNIQVDTKGPSIISLVTDPLSPVKNSDIEPVTVQIQFTLDEVMKQGQVPDLAYQLSGPGRVATPVNDLVKVNDMNWTANLILPADAGSGDVETLNFVYQGIDYLDNISSELLNFTPVQIYQGDLPPYAAPFSLSGRALPNGEIELVWTDVEGVSDYQLYRQAPGEIELSEYVRTGVTTTYIDQTGLDGEYTYTVASVRTDNNEEAVSAQSESVTLTSDAVAPDAPSNLISELTPVGVQFNWDATPSEDIESFSLYRAEFTPITSVDGLEPEISDIPASARSVVDTAPNAEQPAYVVVAVDAAGNISLPSNTEYLNIDLLPVNTLTVIQSEQNAPVLNWTHTYAGVAGYDLYLGDKETGFKLNTDLIASTQFTDSGYANDDRQYSVVAVDGNGVESLSRSINLPALEIDLQDAEKLQTNLMNELVFEVNSNSQYHVNNARLKVTLAGREHLSDQFSLSADEIRNVPVVIGGYSELLTVSDYSLSMISEPNAGERIELARSGQVMVEPGILQLDLETQNFVRGGSGEIRFAVENPGEAQFELLTALSNGNADSTDIRAVLKDGDGNVLSSKRFRQATGSSVTTLSSGQTVARVATNSSFTSEWFEIDIPVAAPDSLVLELVIDNIYSELGKTEQVTLSGAQTSRSVLLVDTPYTGGNIAVSPMASFGDQDIVITGQALDRQSNVPVANVDLDLIIRFSGFEREYAVTTDADGNFAHTYTPQNGESGNYRVSVIHPDLTERPEDASFVINDVILRPNNLQVTIPRQYEQNLPIVAYAGEGTELTNVRLALRAEDQAGGVLPQGINLTLPDAVSLSSGEQVDLPVVLTLDDLAEETGEFILVLLSDESADTAIATATINYELTEAVPALYYSPSHIDTGVTLEGTVSESLTLENRGVVVLDDVNLQLLRADNFPAPDWVTIDTVADIGDIAVGDKRQVGINIQPQNQAAPGIYEFKLRVAASNHPVRDIPIYVAVTEAGEGGYLFKVSDIYTATLDENGNVIQGLENATIRVQNEDVPSIDFTMQTDGIGEAFFEDLPAGKYSYWASADKHQEKHGRVQVRPGTVLNESVFLDYNLINLEWSVTEITIEDRYEITLTATYEVDVPAAVVVFEPSSITLPDMQPGDVFNGELTLTNYGLIRADSVEFDLPQTDAYYKYEFLEAGLPETMEAKEVVTIPYRITALSSLDAVVSGSGGGCYAYRSCASSNATFTCANGDRSSSSSSACYTRSYGSCGGGGGGGIGGGWSSGYGGYGGGGSGTGSGFGTPPEGLPRCREKGQECGGSAGNGAGDQ